MAKFCCYILRTETNNSSGVYRPPKQTLEAEPRLPAWKRSLLRNFSAGRATWPLAGLRPRRPAGCRSADRRPSFPPPLTPLETNKHHLSRCSFALWPGTQVESVCSVPDWERPSLKPMNESSSVMVLPVRLQWVRPSAESHTGRGNHKSTVLFHRHTTLQCRFHPRHRCAVCTSQCYNSTGLY